ncbi:AsmA-like C-terminal domain-containing protein [Thermodesulfobacteriota bacterium]
MFFKKIRSFAVPAALLILLFISILFLANTLIQRPSVQEYLINRVSDVIEFDIRTGEIELNVWQGIGILIHDFEAISRHGNGSVTASRVRIILDTGELIGGHIVPSSIHLFQPRIVLALKDKFNLMADRNGAGLSGFPVFWIPGIQAILIEQGHIDFVDRSLNLDDFYLNAQQTSPIPLSLKIRSSGKMGFRGIKVPFDLNGIILQPPGDNVSTFVDVMLKTGKVPLNWIPWPESIQVKQGDFETILKIDGNPAEQISVNGEIKIKPLQLELLSHDQKKDLSLPVINLDFQALMKGKKIRFHSLNLKNPDIFLDLDLMLDMNESDKPYLKLLAKSQPMTLETFKSLFPSPLIPPWFENKLFPILNTGNIRLKLLSLKGNTDQFRNLQMAGNRSALEIGLECRNFEVSGRGIQPPFKELSALVTLKDGDFRVSDLKTRFGNSNINDAELDVKGILGNSPFFEVLVDGSFDLQDLIRQNEMEFMVSKARRQLGQLSELTGRLEFKARFGYKYEWEFPRILSGEFLFQNCSFSGKELLLPFALKKAEIHIDEMNQNSFSSSGSWGNTEFKMKGDFGIEGNSFDFRKVDISADMDMNQAIPIFYQWDKTRLSFNEPVTWHMSMTKKSDHWSCKGEIDLEGVALESEEISIDPPGMDKSIMFDVGFRPRGGVDLNAVVFRLKDSSIMLSGTYNLLTKDFLELDLHSPVLSMESLGIHYKRKGITTRGTLNGRVKISLFGRNMEDTSVSGRIEGKDLSFHLSRFPSVIRDCSFQLDISGREAAINNWKMKIGESPLYISGKIKGWDVLKGDIVVNSDFLNLADILPPEDSSLLSDRRDNQDSLINGMDMGVKLDISRGIWRKLVYGSVKAELDLKGRDIYFKKTKVNLENGVLSANGHLITGHKPELMLSGHMKLTDQPIDELLDSIGVGDKGLKGRLTMEAFLLMKGEKAKDLVPSLSGIANIKIEDGLIKKSGVFLKVLDFLSLENALKQRPPDLSEEGFYFKNMSGEAFIDKGILRSDNFVMRSPVFNAVAYGKTDIPQKTVDFILGIQPHGTIDSLVSKIPILGYIITGENSSILAYPFKVKGPVTGPEVKFTPFEKLGKGVGGILQRLFLTPVRILDDLQNATKKVQEKDSSSHDR